MKVAQIFFLLASCCLQMSADDFAASTSPITIAATTKVEETTSTEKPMDADEADAESTTTEPKEVKSSSEGTSTSTMSTTESEPTIISTVEHEPTTRMVELTDGLKIIIYENGTYELNGTLLNITDLDTCSKFVNTDPFGIMKIMLENEQCEAETTVVEYQYRKWWGIGLGMIIGTAASCCLCYLCICLDCYLKGKEEVCGIVLAR